MRSRRETAVEHELHQARQLEARGHVARRDDCAVPVAAERGVVFANGLHDVREVIDDRGRAAAAPVRAAEIAAVEDHADHAAGVGDRAQLRVVEIAPARVNARHSGMRGEQRLSAVMDLDGVEEAARVDVRQIDEHAALVECSTYARPTRSARRDRD